MQIDRVLDILLHLLKYKKTTALDLAERFGVNVRTIYRDIDTLSLAGLPVYSIQGRYGGIYLDETYLLERNVLTKTEKEQMDLALELLQSTNLFPMEQLINKYRLSAQSDNTYWITFELGDAEVGVGTRLDILLIKEAVLEQKIIRFVYYSEYGQTSLKTVCPVKVIYRQGDFHLLGYCQDNQEYQMFLLHRMRQFTLTSEHFILTCPVVLPEEPTVAVRLRFSKRISYKIYDEFFRHKITKNDDGSYEIDLHLYNNESLYSYLLSFGDNVEILSPIWLKESMVKRIRSFLKANQI